MLASVDKLMLRIENREQRIWEDKHLQCSEYRKNNTQNC